MHARRASSNGLLWSTRIFVLARSPMVFLSGTLVSIVIFFEFESSNPNTEASACSRSIVSKTTWVFSLLLEINHHQSYNGSTFPYITSIHSHFSQPYPNPSIPNQPPLFRTFSTPQKLVTKVFLAHKHSARFL